MTDKLPELYEVGGMPHTNYVTKKSVRAREQEIVKELKICKKLSDPNGVVNPKLGRCIEELEKGQK